MADIEDGTSIQNETAPENDGVTWWCKLLVRVIGVVAAIVSIIASITNVIYVIAPLHVITGVLMIINGALLLLFEAPICCQFSEKTKLIGAWIDKRKYWQKGIIYIVLAIIPLLPSRDLSSILGCIPVFATGVFYGLLSLGKKADRGEMLSKAQGNDGNKYQQFENTP